MLRLFETGIRLSLFIYENFFTSQIFYVFPTIHINPNSLLIFFPFSPILAPHPATSPVDGNRSIAWYPGPPLRCAPPDFGCKIAVTLCFGQNGFNVSGFRQLHRSTVNAPEGRVVRLDDILLRYYTNSTKPTSMFKIKDAKQLLAEPTFNVTMPTLVYAHGYVELTTDKSVEEIVKAYITKGGYNIVVADWSNLAFGNYLLVALDVGATGKTIGKAIIQLLKGGLLLDGLHFVGHSLGCHVMSAAARALLEEEYRLPRLTGLDPAFPGFAYPLLLGQPMTSSDAAFVDVIHTDGGTFGTPVNSGHADFWPNQGQARQPGCQATVPLSDDGFCSHWRSWALWTESVLGGEFLARRCQNYDNFIRGLCKDSPLVYMGLRATPK
ncbi:hypothetical protein O3G_MSEX007065 [Manduca sexta]|uniref:Esterase n=1 Tax=Manduca sexta TaxID=7130 RepID=A0A921Z583_MANSE|nr:hypothetical protein O3G_MSEX007065 [Manduca sexta]UXP71897.1 esterase [Manduca sexta]